MADEKPTSPAATPSTPPASTAPAAPTPIDHFIRSSVDKTIESLKTRLGIQATSGTRAGRRVDKLPPGDVSIIINFQGAETKGLAILTFPKAVFSQVFAKLSQKIDLSIGVPDELTAWANDLASSIAQDLKLKNYSMEPCLVSFACGKEIFPCFPSNLAPVAIPFEAAGGTFHGEFGFIAPGDVKLRVPKDIRILVADDSQMARKSITRFLTQMGFTTIIESRDGEDALQGVMGGITINKPFDLVLCDLHMPKLNGIELIKKIRANDKTKHIKFIMFTGDQDLENVKVALAAGVNSYLVKPVSQDNLAKKIESVWNPKQPTPTK